MLSGLFLAEGREHSGWIKAWGSDSPWYSVTKQLIKLLPVVTSNEKSINDKVLRDWVASQKGQNEGHAEFKALGWAGCF